jgi:hypothetical protein
LALALDEPKEEDETHQIDGLKFIVAKSVTRMLKRYGEINVSFHDYPWGGQIMVKAGEGEADSCCS